MGAQHPAVDGFVAGFRNSDNVLPLLDEDGSIHLDAAVGTGDVVEKMSGADALVTFSLACKTLSTTILVKSSPCLTIGSRIPRLVVPTNLDIILLSLFLDYVPCNIDTTRTSLS